MPAVIACCECTVQYPAISRPFATRCFDCSNRFYSTLCSYEFFLCSRRHMHCGVAHSFDYDKDRSSAASERNLCLRLEGGVILRRPFPASLDLHLSSPSSHDENFILITSYQKLYYPVSEKVRSDIIEVPIAIKPHLPTSICCVTCLPAGRLDDITPPTPSPSLLLSIVSITTN